MLGRSQYGSTLGYMPEPPTVPSVITAEELLYLSLPDKQTELTAGSRLVWVVDPGRERAVVYRDDGSVDLLTNRDAHSGEDVLPGFSCPLADAW